MMVQSSIGVSSLAASIFILSQIQAASANKTVACEIDTCKDPLVCDTSTGKCIANPCNTVDCREGYECRVKYVQCVTFPCPPIAECQPIEPCEINSCKDPLVCDISTGKCIENPCNTVRCRSGYECQVQYVQCFKAPCPPLAECRPTCAGVTCPEGEMCEDGQCVLDNRCASVLCMTGTYCFKGSCFEDVPCNEDECGPAHKCYKGIEPCSNPPCPTKTICRPDKCALVRCTSATKCVDGKCIPLNDCI